MAISRPARSVAQKQPEDAEATTTQANNRNAHPQAPGRLTTYTSQHASMRRRGDAALRTLSTCTSRKSSPGSLWRSRRSVR
ncbi:Uncharacterised protein [Mycobacteroides abscessus subsp. abscessus]|nr:Uncharacterised protein [Mycobacteroides abscessus subsp. abscessus]